MGERRRKDHFHWPLIVSTLAALLSGLTNLYSAAYATQPGYFYTQLAWSGLAIVFGFMVFLADYRIYERVAYIFFGIVVLMLIGAFFSRSVAATHRWLVIGAFRIQPSELMKVVMVLTLAKYFHNSPAPKDGYSIWQLRRIWLVVFIPLLMILKQPDLGTAMLLGAISFTILLFVKIRLRHLMILVMIFLVLVPISWHYVLKDYQKNRILTLFDPDSDPRGTGYHRRQSIIAVGSGQLYGKGFMEGTQTQLRFLPEQHTDFIFSVWAEEQGFIGSMGLLLFYLTIILSGIHIASRAREKFGVLLAVGATAVIFWHVFINIGMVTGILPVVGVTLPLMSYGGSSLVTTLTCVALLLNVYARRHLF